jgi:hypothetical protein
MLEWVTSSLEGSSKHAQHRPTGLSKRYQDKTLSLRLRAGGMSGRV